MLVHRGCQVTWSVLVVSFLVAVHHCLTSLPTIFLESVVNCSTIFNVVSCLGGPCNLVSCGVVHVHSCTSTVLIFLVGFCSIVVTFIHQSMKVRLQGLAWHGSHMGV